MTFGKKLFCVDQGGNQEININFNSLSNFLHEVLDQLAYYYYMLARFASTLPWGLELLKVIDWCVLQAWQSLPPTPKTQIALLPLDDPPKYIPIWAPPILWHPLEEGLCLLELFKGIHTNLVAMFHVDIRVCKYMYVNPNTIAQKNLHAPCGDDVGLVDMVIARWSCQGHSQASTCNGLFDP